MLCYTSAESEGYVNIVGEARYKEKLWNYEAKLPSSNFTNNLLVLVEALSKFTEQYLSERGLILSEGTIVDASIISAPSSTKNEKQARDSEMK